ncbi:MAG: Asp-tRNA(Asn)/Glu-tRNA(Gln) amidotransferase subunit GatC [Victivallaceae bacterium]|nr:Asp-tRNA(Asn)/Glu-tRNA(Gln) amidotransferase subunit GatC [Victivallaceae bacterium]
MSDRGQIDVGYVAGLARLELDPETKVKLQKDMEGILAYIEQLEELDVSGIEPTAHATLLTNVVREDIAGESFPRTTMLANAPAEVNDELIKVARVLPGEGMS